MKEGEIYIHKKGFLFRVKKIYTESTILMELLNYNEDVIDTVKTWDAFKMKKLFP